jgi:hypothetical protein
MYLESKLKGSKTKKDTANYTKTIISLFQKENRFSKKEDDIANCTKTTIYLF